MDIAALNNKRDCPKSGFSRTTTFLQKVIFLMAFKLWSIHRIKTVEPKIYRRIPKG